MKNSLRDAVAFARWCIRHEIEPLEAAKLREHIDKSAQAWIRANDSSRPQELRERDERTHKRHQEAIEADVKAWGWKTDWPGLYPVFASATDSHIMVPEV